MKNKNSQAGPSRPRRKIVRPSSSLPPAAQTAFDSSASFFAVATTSTKVNVYDAASDRPIAEYELDESAGHVTCLSWLPYNGGPARPSKKRKGKSAAVLGSEAEHLVITTDNGDILIYSVHQDEVVKTETLAEPITAVARCDYGLLLADPSALFLLTRDGKVAGAWDLPDTLAEPTAITPLPGLTSKRLAVAVARDSVVILHLNLDDKESISYTGSSVNVTTSTSDTSSSVSSLLAIQDSAHGVSFLVASAGERTVEQYTVDKLDEEAWGRPRLSYRFAPATLSPVHSITLSASEDELAVLHESGDICVFRRPSSFNLKRPTTDNKPHIVRLVEGKDGKQSQVAGLAFSSSASSDESALLCARMPGPRRISWVKATYDPSESGDGVSIVPCTSSNLVNGDAQSHTIKTQRYSAPAPPIAPLPETGDEPSASLPTDVDMAEASLGERLLALAPSGTDHLPNGVSHSHPVKRVRTLADGPAPTNAASLTRILVQALHTSDTALLNTCLVQRDPALIRNTIRKMPAQLALPLLKACVERLGSGPAKRGKNGPASGAVQHEQQARGTIEWVKAVMAERGAILMTIPSLPLHLGQLSQLLSARLQLYQPLQALSGRLDLAMAQINIRRAAEASSLSEGMGKRSGAARYVEGESSDEEDESDDDEEDAEDEDEDDELAPVRAPEEGVTEDVHMGAFGDSDDDDEDGEELEEDDDEGDEEADLSDEGALELEELESDEDDDEDEEEEDE